MLSEARATVAGAFGSALAAGGGPLRNCGNDKTRTRVSQTNADYSVDGEIPIRKCFLLVEKPLGTLRRASRAAVNNQLGTLRFATCRRVE